MWSVVSEESIDLNDMYAGYTKDTRSVTSFAPPRAKITLETSVSPQRKKYTLLYPVCPSICFNFSGKVIRNKVFVSIDRNEEKWQWITLHIETFNIVKRIWLKVVPLLLIHFAVWIVFAIRKSRLPSPGKECRFFENTSEKIQRSRTPRKGDVPSPTVRSSTHHIDTR